MRATVIRHTHLLEVNVIGKLHVLGVDTEDLETACGIGDTNVNFTIKSSKSSESGVNRIRAVGSSHDDNI